MGHPGFLQVLFIHPFLMDTVDFQQIVPFSMAMSGSLMARCARLEHQPTSFKHGATSPDGDGVEVQRLEGKKDCKQPLILCCLFDVFLGLGWKGKLKTNNWLLRGSRPALVFDVAVVELDPVGLCFGCWLAASPNSTFFSCGRWANVGFAAKFNGRSDFSRHTPGISTVDMCPSCF